MRYVCTVVTFSLFLTLAVSGATFTVTNTNDSGPGSLRQALTDASAASPAAATVAFSIGSGVRTIIPLSVLPSVGQNVTLDGSTQPGYAGTPLIELNDSLIPVSPFEECLLSFGIVRAIAINRCSGRGLSMYLGRVTACFIGTDVTGHTALPNTVGIVVFGAFGPAPQVGGNSDAEGNLVSGNLRDVTVSSAPGTEISHNRIGTDVSGETALGSNGSAAVSVEYTTDVLIHDNVIAAHSMGIECFYSDRTIINNNHIGVSASGNPLPNTTGIHVYQSNFTQIGAAGGNVIAYNIAGGIEMDGASIRNTIHGNSIHHNGQIGIDLSLSYTFDGVTLNDSGDSDTGPNLLQNYPILTNVTSIGAQTVVTGTINSTPNQLLSLDFYASASCSSSGYGEGETPLGTASVQTDANGNGNFFATLSATLPFGSVVTATATDPFGNTSEFSACLPSVQGSGTFALANAAVLVDEGAGSATIVVNRTSGAAGAASVNYATANGTAIAGSDYTATAGTLTFANGETSKTFSIPITDDLVFEGNESFTVALSGATNGASIGNPQTATVTITDNDPAPSISIADAQMNEGNSGTTNMPFSVTLTGASPVPVTVQYQTISNSALAGSDFQGVSGTLTFNPGETQKTINVPIFGDTITEPDETFFVTLISPSNATITRSSATGTIVNDDAGIGPSQLSVPRGGTAPLTVNLFSTVPQTIALTSSDPTVASVPATVQIVGSGEIEVTGKQTGSTTITAILPTASGSLSVLIQVSVYEPATLVLAPKPISVSVGETVTVSAMFAPGLTTPEGVTLNAAGNGAVSIPDRLIIDPGQTSTFSVEGVRQGQVTLTAMLGPAHGGTVFYFNIEVADPPTTPVITQIVPANGPAAGGTSVAINGANLRNDCTVRFGGVPASNVVFVSSSSLTATTPGHTAGVADVALACGTDLFNFTNGFTYLAAAATLSNVTPTFGATAGNTIVRITGTNIASGCWPFFDGFPARAATVNSAAEMIASTPAHATTGTIPLALRCSGAADVSLANAYTYSSAAESAPVITAVAPLVGSSGKSVTISGARFRYDDSVTFDAVRATILSTAPDTHVVRIPDLPLGMTSITVTDLGGHVSTTGPIFAIVEPQPPQITGITPAAARPGNEVALDGTGFRPGYSFTIGDQPATLLSLSYTRVILRVPQLESGAYAVNVLNAASAIAAIGPKLSVLDPGLAITRVSPVCVTSEGGARMTITGTGFAAGAIATLDGASVNTTVVDAQTISVTLPSLPAGMASVVVTNANGDSASLSNAFTVKSPFDPSGCTPRIRPMRP